MIECGIDLANVYVRARFVDGAVQYVDCVHRTEHLQMAGCALACRQITL